MTRRMIATIGVIGAMGISFAFGAMHADRQFRTIVPNGDNLFICDMSGEPDCWPIPDNR